MGRGGGGEGAGEKEKDLFLFLPPPSPHFVSSPGSRGQKSITYYYSMVMADHRVKVKKDYS